MDRARTLAALIVVTLGMVASARAQEPATREAAIEQAQAEKVETCIRTSPARSKRF